MKMRIKRSLAIVLTLALAVSALPFSALAANVDDFVKAEYVCEIKDEKIEKIVGFSLLFKGEQQDEIKAEDITDLKVTFQEAAEIDMELKAEVKKETKTEKEDDKDVTYTLYTFTFDTELIEAGSYEVSGAYKTVTFSLSAVIGEDAGSDPDPSDPDPADEPADWAKEHVDALREKSLIPEGLLSAYTTPIRRDEFTALMFNIYTYLSEKEVPLPDENVFTDIDDSNYKEVVMKAHSIGLIAGRGDGIFDPAGILNRQELAAMINSIVAVIEEIEIPDAEATTFEDNNLIDAWAIKHVAYCQSRSLLAGRTGNVFDPKTTLNRQEAMTGANNILRVLESEE